MSAWLRKRLQGVAIFMARTLNRFLDWLFQSRHPAIVFVRETIRRNRILISVARAFIRAVRGLPTLQQNFRERFKSASVRRLQSILAARAVGGIVTASEFERIWDVAKRGMRVRAIADGREREQLEIILDAIAVRTTFCSTPEACEAVSGVFDLTIAAPVDRLEHHVAELESREQTSGKFIRLGARRSDYFARASFVAVLGEGDEGERLPLKEKIAKGQALRVVFLNDVGFQYGAGVALKRQVASLLLKGWEVSLVSATPGNLLEPPAVTGVKNFPNWRGVHNISALQASKGLDAQDMSEWMGKIGELNPDVVITGNLHSTARPFDLLRELRSRSIHVVPFMHDTYFVTGRCAQPLTCTMYRTGCDARCPTPDEYPRLAPEKIAAAWRERGELFTGSNRLPLIGNSKWTQNIVLQRFGDAATSGFVHLALDHELFAPIPKRTARRLLGIRDDKPVVVLGAVDVHNQWKGGPLFHGLHKALAARKDIALVLFGRSSDTLSSQKSFGLVTDDRMMPLILSAGDVFVSTATAESFGQSLLEASACAVPVVAFDVGGASDVVVDGETGILVQEPSVAGLLEAIDRLIANPSEREALGRAGRTRVTDKFTLIHQADAWVDCLKRIC